MEITGASRSWKSAAGRWTTWFLTICVLAIGSLTLQNSALAQQTTRKLASGPPPEYPELARKMNIHGSVRVMITITKDGRVKTVKEVGGNPVLLQALTEAVKKWRYEPAENESQLEVKYDFNGS